MFFSSIKGIDSLYTYYPFTLTAAKRDLTIMEIFYLQKHFLIFEGEMLIRSRTTTLHQIFCELLLHSQVIFKSMKVADDTF